MFFFKTCFLSPLHCFCSVWTPSSRRYSCSCFLSLQKKPFAAVVFCMKHEKQPLVTWKLPELDNPPHQTWNLNVVHWQFLFYFFIAVPQSSVFISVPLSHHPLLTVNHLTQIGEDWSLCQDILFLLSDPFVFWKGWGTSLDFVNSKETPKGVFRLKWILEVA